MLNRVYCEILGVPATADSRQVKTAYRALVRRYHPDLSAPEDRSANQLRMMQINQAYEQLTLQLRGLPIHRPIQQTTAPAAQTPDSREMGAHSDPAYAYYKQGFISYSEGVGGMLARGYLKLSADQRGFERTLMALRCFHRAHGYFQRVVSEYPDSIWARDAGYRLHRIERFNVIYRRIQKNLQDRLARAEHEHPAGSAKSQRESSAESNQSAIVDEQ